MLETMHAKEDDLDDLSPVVAAFRKLCASALRAYETP
jgi:hypothetical protein